MLDLLGKVLRRIEGPPVILGTWRPFSSSSCCFATFMDINNWLLFYGILYLVLYAQVSQSKTCERTSCFSGRCVNSSCLCDQGWVGDQCQHCQGRFKLTESSGYLTDGPINYKYKTKCTWLIEGFPNSVLRLRFNHFATECSWDHMYVYDGDSIYAPLIAVF
ncbi:PREDICTED: attractin-like protein 1, partial [Thamnophis sirtalis]|uniref:Attractin-like protein 1 n=4 Tax=Thamnophis TaxID=34999 RepID=A0A6I9Z3V5_9SAUR